MDDKESLCQVKTTPAAQFTYTLDEIPPLKYLVLLGLQWLAIGIPSVIVIGKLVSGLHCADPLDIVLYLQKLTFITGVTLLFQIMVGHRLPLIVGPSTILIIGVIAGRDFGENTIYTAIIVGGVLFFLSSITGIFGKLRGLFTPRVVAVVLLLITFTLLPSTLNLITGPATSVPVSSNFFFGIGFAFTLLVLQRYLKGIWQLTLMLWGMLAGSALYFFLFPDAMMASPHAPYNVFSLFFKDLTIQLSFNTGVVISFIFSFMALSVNDLGAIHSMKDLLGIQDIDRRVNRGLTITGLANVLSGFLGVIGPVNFSISPGVVLSTRCASRYVLLPAAALFILFSFSPVIIGFFGNIPSVIIGGIIIYVLCAQVAAGLIVVFRDGTGFTYENGLVIALPIILGCLVSFLSPAVVIAIPAVLKPIVCNGFVVGVITVMILEHVVFRQKR